MKKRIKRESIALIHYSAPPIIGGVEEVLRQQANLFYRYYHKVKIIAGEGGEFSRDYEIVFNPLLTAKNKAVLEAHRKAIENKDFSKIYQVKQKIYRFLKEQLNHTDIAIVHNVLSMAFNLPFTLALLEIAEEGRTKVISWNHDSPYFYPDYPEYLDEEPWNVLKTTHSKITYVAITQSRKEQFAQLYRNENIEVITNGVDPIEFFRFTPLTVRIIKELELFSADLLVLQPFRMVRRKNIELSIRVLKALKDKGVNAKFILTGKYDPHSFDSKKYHKELVALIKKLGLTRDFIILTDIKLKGGQRVIPSREMLKDFYQLCDLLFLPSKQEGFGLPLLEGGMHKLPIVCSNISPFREIGGDDVEYFELDDPPEEIAERILRFLNSFAPGRLFRKVFRDYILDNIYFKKILPLFEKIHKENPRI